MVHDRIWFSVATKRVILCIGCLEARLGRKLGPDDFTNVPANNVFKYKELFSDRLLNRMGWMRVVEEEE